MVSLVPFYSHLLMQDHTAVPLFIWRSGITQGGPEDGGVRLAGGAPCPSAEAIEINDQNAVASVPLGRTDPSKDPQETNKLHRKWTGFYISVWLYPRYYPSRTRKKGMGHNSWPMHPLQVKVTQFSVCWVASGQSHSQRSPIFNCTPSTMTPGGGLCNTLGPKQKSPHNTPVGQNISQKSHTESEKEKWNEDSAWEKW